MKYWSLLSVNFISKCKRLSYCTSSIHQVGTEQLQAAQKMTRTLKQIRSAEEWLQLVDENREQMNTVHVSAAATAAGKIFQNKQFNKNTAVHIYQELINLLNTNRVNLDARGIATGLWSLAKLSENVNFKNQNNDLFVQICSDLCDDAIRTQNQLNEQALVNIIWSMAKINSILQLPEQFQIFMNICFQDRENFNSQEIAIILWSMGTYKYSNLEHIHAFVELSKYYISDFSSQNISNVIWAQGQMRYLNEEFLNLVEDCLIMKKYDFTCQQLSNIIFAFAALNYQPRNQVVEKVIGRFLLLSKANQKRILFQESCNLIYALSILKSSVQLAQPIIDQMFEIMDNRQQTSQKQNSLQLLPVQLKQLQRAKMQFMTMGQKLRLPEEIQRSCVKKWLEYIHERTFRLNNNDQDEIFDFIKQNYPDAVQNRTDQNGYLEVRNCVQNDGQKVCVRVLENGMLILNQKELIVGSVRAYNELLEFAGWKVIQVYKDDWKSSNISNVKNELLQKLQVALKV